MAKLFYEGIKDIPRIKIYGNVDCSEAEFYSRLPIISLNIGKISSGVLSQFLADKYEIYTRSGGPGIYGQVAVVFSIVFLLALGFWGIRKRA